MESRSKTRSGGSALGAWGPGLDVMLRRMPACMWSTDMDLRLTASGGAGLAALGLEPDQLVGSTVDELVDGSQSRAAEHHQRARAGETVDYEVDTGSFRWQVHLEPLRSEDGEIVGTVGLALDVSREAAAEEQVREAETRYQLLVGQIPVITYREEVVAPNATVFVSSQIQDILGYTQEEWLEDGGTLWYRLLHPDDHDDVIAENDRTNDTLEPFIAEYRLIGRNGRVVWVHDEARLIRDEHGRPLHWQGVYFDVTERHRAEEALRKAFERERDAAERLRALDDMKNMFLTAVSHELRTPLSAILGIALTLDRGGVDVSGDESRELLHALAGNARKLERLLSDLLDLDRLSRGIVEPRRSPTDVAELARTVAASMNVAGDHRVVVAEGSVMAGVDPAQVERIIENLLSNAGRYTPLGTEIRVRVDREPDGVLLVVDDDGPGVPDGLREAIFRPFEQVPGRRVHSPGVGVGLSLVARFAELHGGRAWMEARPGGGSSFRVLLPDAAAGAVAEESA